MAAKTARAQTQRAPTVEAASVHVSLPQMLDLALGTPEVGAVNLNILHNFLHVLLHQINLRTTKVEYRGEDAKRIKTMVASAKAGPSLHLHEYSITDGSGKVKQRIHSTDQVTVNVDVFTEEDHKNTDYTSVSAPVTPRNKKTENVTTDTAVTKTKGVKQQITPGAEGERENIIFIEPIVDGAVPSALAFNKLEKSVEHLEQRFEALDELSTNPELVERLKGNITDPLTDMWNIININRRLDATEQGIDKLTSMVQDVMKTGVDLENLGEHLKPSYNVENRNRSNTNASTGTNNNEINQYIPNEEETTVTNVNPGNVGSAQSEQTPETPEQTPETPEQTPEIPAQTPEIPQQKNNNRNNSQPTETRNTSIETCLKNIQNVETKLDNALTKIEERLRVLERKEEITVDTTEREEDESAPVKSLNEEDKRKIQICLENIEDLRTTFDNNFTNIEARLQKVEKEGDELTEKLKNVAKPSETGDSDLNELVSKIQDIQEDLRKLNETADHLIGDTEDREMNLNAMLEQIELLKTIKADKEDLEDALADKADTHAVNRKVSHDQFNAACDDLTRGLEEAISKLGKQESIWQQSLDEVQKEIEGKVDKIEITPLREFVNNRLKSLQEKMKRMAEMRREAEAAGTKKLLRDVQCISCDKEVVMRTEETGKFEAPSMPCTMSMKPYLTYELDQVRKQQRRLPHSRNMIQFEAAVLEETKKMKTAKEELFTKSPRDHLCNRYCGGSHTITTPQQRVMRMGHFLTQWGPESIQLTEGMIQGTDGKMYRSRPLPPKYDVCGGIVSCPATEAIQSQETSKCGNMSQTWQTARSLPSARKGNSARTSARKKEVCPGVSTENEHDAVPLKPVNKVALEVQSTTEA
ncbi:MATH and LRR domain-containing protein PFE0570w-like [Vespula squamosa]|uniref:MATH and LRR domain-containing protein PFE0570w-like n=1 Tax=Vespula squamosa TaxID=30214 RepID=A0ABD1ZXP4_VESSQ